MQKLVLFIISCAFLCSCNEPPPDVPACQHLKIRHIFDADNARLIKKPSPTCMIEIQEHECGHCVWVVSGKEKYVGEKPENHLGGKPWSQIREEAVIVPSEMSYAPMSTYMINQCKKLKCHKEINKFRVKFKKNK